MPSQPVRTTAVIRPRARGRTAAGLSASTILASALALIERDGYEALTLRRLAAELDVTAMALYSHFRDKRALIEAVLDAVLGELELAAPTTEWRPWLHHFAVAARDIFLRHPGFVRLLVENPSTGPNALDIGERTYRVLLDGGVPPATAVQGFWTILTYVVGFVALETPRKDSSVDDPVEAERQRGHYYAGLDRRVYPLTVELAPHIAAMVSAEQFEAGLSTILNGMAASIA